MPAHPANDTSRGGLGVVAGQFPVMIQWTTESGTGSSAANAGSSACSTTTAAWPARAESTGCWPWGHFGDECMDVCGDVVADGANGVEGLARWIVEFPVAVGPSGEVGTGAPASHGDHDVAALHGVGSEDFGRGAAEADAFSPSL